MLLSFIFNDMTRVVSNNSTPDVQCRKFIMSYKRCFDEIWPMLTNLCEP